MLLAQLSLCGPSERVVVLRCNGVCRKVDDTLFYCIPPEEFDTFDIDAFYQVGIRPSDAL